MISIAIPWTQNWNWHFVTQGDMASHLQEKWQVFPTYRQQAPDLLQQVPLRYVTWHALQGPETVSFRVSLWKWCCSLLKNHGEGHPLGSGSILTALIQESKESPTFWTGPSRSLSGNINHRNHTRICCFKIEFGFSWTTKRCECHKAHARLSSRLYSEQQPKKPYRKCFQHAQNNHLRLPNGLSFHSLFIITLSNNSNLLSKLHLV